MHDVAPHTSLRMCEMITVRGVVQGVGFRPFVYLLASELGLTGWVRNSPKGVTITVEGDPAVIAEFERRLEVEKPVNAVIHQIGVVEEKAGGFTDFRIVESESEGERSTLLLPDLATCPECLVDIFTPGSRRYRYPFTNCTHCGPRYSIITALPYDRKNTSMAAFEMCDDCKSEYENPHDRRFHAQPNACPLCGPSLVLWSKSGRTIARHHAAMETAAAILRHGGIVAVKGIGGFHLMTDARNNAAVRSLRSRKHREEKPLALMYPSVAAIEADCDVTTLEMQLLKSTAAPIVLVKRRNGAAVSRDISPGNPRLGVMLPYTPLHHILMGELGFAVVATSGNLSEEPICTDEHEAVKRLGGIADAFLVHNRPIVRHVDDSIVQTVDGSEVILRRARGYAPLPVAQGDDVPRFCVGAFLKNAVAIATPRDVFVSQHIGNLETWEALSAFTKVGEDLRKLLDVQPEEIVSDMHPDYPSTHVAVDHGLPVEKVQHHHAHIAACMAEHQLDGEVFGVAWDGAGMGTDGTIWGGEFLGASPAAFQRFGHLRPFPLPGGDRAAREPRRSALGLLMAAGTPFVFNELLVKRFHLTQKEVTLMTAMLSNGINSPVTSSVGRLFDAVASIAGIRQVSSFEGQAAMELEFAINGCATDQYYEIPIAKQNDVWIADWKPMLDELLGDVMENETPVPIVSAKFHNGLAQLVCRMATVSGYTRVVLSGGCFQNTYLLERTIQVLRSNGFHPLWHRRVPTNDGGICLGQYYVAAARRRESCTNGKITVRR